MKSSEFLSEGANHESWVGKNITITIGGVDQSARIDKVADLGDGMYALGDVPGRNIKFRRKLDSNNNLMKFNNRSDEWVYDSTNNTANVQTEQVAEVNTTTGTKWVYRCINKGHETPYEGPGAPEFTVRPCPQCGSKAMVKKVESNLEESSNAEEIIDQYNQENMMAGGSEANLTGPDTVTVTSLDDFEDMFIGSVADFATWMQSMSEATDKEHAAWMKRRNSPEYDYKAKEIDQMKHNKGLSQDYFDAQAKYNADKDKKDRKEAKFAADKIKGIFK